MKIYSHINTGGFSNTYLIANENTKEAIIVDPGKISEGLINQIEENSLNLVAILITHNHGSHVSGLKTIMKIYMPKIYGADYEIAGDATNVITGDGSLRLAGLSVKYISLPGHTSDSMIYQIGNAIFTGDSISAGKLGSTNSSYSRHLLRHNIDEKILSQQENTILFPGHGPPTSVGAERKFNINISKE
ncbi:MAG: MBL fold metallo-hydrolase [Treponema sp.]|nr:MBL fold metallo-hydrolase [Treponema sp.]